MSIYEYRPMLIYFIVLAFCFGTCMGSFLNCAAWRITHGESFLKGRSHCPSCGHTLGFIELIPVLGWIILKGRCQHCKNKISIRYLLTEVAFGLITVLCLLRFVLTVLCLRNYGFLCILFLLTLTDIDMMIIPDGCHVAALILWILAEPFLFTGWIDFAEHIAAALVFGGGLLAVSLVMDRVLGRESLGGGDIKLFGVVGLYMGMIGTMFVMIIACLAGLVFHLLFSAKSAGDHLKQESAYDQVENESADNQEVKEEKAFPFGPWIAAATAFMLLFGAPLIQWYSGLLG